MAAHLPGADTVGQYWKNLCAGVSSISRFSPEDLRAAGEDPARMAQPSYVPAGAPLDGVAAFDPAFFGFGPKDAAILDPQHRHFLEVAWQAFEDAGHAPGRHLGPVGVYAGCGMGSYFYFNICSNPDLVDGTGMFLLRHTGNDKDFLATRVSHVLDLTGPSVNIQTACSTSLVAVHYAIEALRRGEISMAVAGGVTIELPERRGYLYEDGGVLSPDGECHAFDHRAKGTVFGSGAGAVVLRRLGDALADGDHVWAVIKGSAVNNDGADKANYLAPSIDRQADAVAAAIADADVPADTIGYVECHGTGTYLGDPIEVDALTQAFRRSTEASGFCRIGSVKTNIGHLDTAAGVASLIKAALAVHHGQIPPSLGYDKPNPAIDFENSPFRVADRLDGWSGGGPDGTPRRAGVNSLGVGGTNAHVVLEAPPPQAPGEPSDWPFHVLCLSGRTRAGLDATAAELAAHLRETAGTDLADIAYTLKEGRTAQPWRRVLVAGTAAEAADLIEAGDPRRVFTHQAVDDAPGGQPGVVFLFPGGGAQYATMARDLYETEPVFREWMDRGLDVLEPRLDYDIRALWLPGPGGEDAANARLTRPSVQLPLIAIVEYALARLWMSWGVRPAALAGHSMGENVAACVAGVLSLEDMIGLVHLRGRLFDTVAPGGMVSVDLGAEALMPYLEAEGLDLAAENAPGLSVASGPDDALARLAGRLTADGVENRRIAIDIAAHSRMLDPILAEFRAFLASIALHPPQIPVISNRTGQALSAAEATDPGYWTGHLRGTVRFADCVGTLAAVPGRVFLECGPGTALTSLVRAHGGVAPGRAVNALRHPDDPVADDAAFLATVGRLWALGVEADWSAIWGTRRRVPLPGYAFQRADYFIQPGQSAARTGLPARIEDMAGWGWRPVWHPSAAACEIDAETALARMRPLTWLVFVDRAGLAGGLVRRLRSAGHTVVEVHQGDTFARQSEHFYTLAPEHGREGYDALIQDLVARGIAPSRIVHGWLITREEVFRPGSSFFHSVQESGFYSLLFLAQAIGTVGLPVPLHLTVLATGAMRVRDEALPYPEKAAALGPVQVIPRELPGVSASFIDLAWPEAGWAGAGWTARLLGRERAMLDRLADQVLEDLLAPPGNAIAALRGPRRFAQAYAPLALPPAPTPAPGSEARTWLLTGGFGGIGLSVAGALAAAGPVNLVLIGRTALPPRADWAEHLRHHGGQTAIAQRIRAVEGLEAAGARVLCPAADVCNAADMARAVEAARASFGRIHGVIHAAGTIDDAPLLAKIQAGVERVFAPKIHGTQVLGDLFPDGSVDEIVLFSSSSTATAPAGQIDYVAANRYLNAFAQARAGGQTRVIALNWGVWRDVGMAARSAGDGATQPPVPAGQPLLAEATGDAAGNRIYTATLGPGTHWVLDEHRTRTGEPVLPGTAYLELAAEALAAQGETGPFEIRDLFLVRPFLAAEGTQKALRLRLARSDEGYGLEVQGAVTLDGRPGWQTHAQARLVIRPMARPGPLDATAIEARCPGAPAADDPGGIRMAQEAHLAFGPRWRVVQRYREGTREGLARLALPTAFRDDLDAGYRLHPALMDLAIGWAMGLVEGYTARHLWVPVSYRAVRVHAPLPADVTSWVRLAEGGTEDGFASFDVTLAAPDGTVCLELDGFSIRRIPDSAAFTGMPPPKAAEIEFEAQARETASSPAARRFRQVLAEGIRADEGAEAFRRALAAGHSLQVPDPVISSLDLPALIRDAAETEAAAPEHRAGRPETGADYRAPGTDIERTLAGFWEDLLGIRDIGIDDSFFDLGGHSLIAVRLFARIRKTYHVDLPISALFEAPTVAASAAMIAGHIGTDADAAAGDASAPTAAPARRFTHLVAMHEGTGGPRTPIFLVAGMFGNVLNLRHLAHLMGADRRFYGLQARGLYGDERPHVSFIEAAADYIAELRQVQPEGPYILGGFSGGGLIAWEMAHQLTRTGAEVAHVALLDTPMPVRPFLSKRDKLIIHRQELLAQGPGYLWRWVRDRAVWEAERVMRRIAPPPESAENRFHDTEIEAAFMTAAQAYQLAPWAGPVTLFRPPMPRRWQVSGERWVSPELRYITEDNGWSDWAGQLDVVEVSGDHDQMVLEPHVRVLAEAMRRVVTAAEARRGDSPAPGPDLNVVAAE